MCSSAYPFLFQGEGVIKLTYFLFISLLYFNQAQKILPKSLHHLRKRYLKAPRIWLLKRNLTYLHLEHLFHLYHPRPSLHHHQRITPILTNHPSPRYEAMNQMVAKSKVSSIQHSIPLQTMLSLPPPPHQKESSFHTVRPPNQKQSPQKQRSKQRLPLAQAMAQGPLGFKCYQ